MLLQTEMTPHQKTTTTTTNKTKEEYFRRTRKLLKTKLSTRNLIKGIDTLAVLFVRYSGPFRKWTREELQQIDQRKRKLMTMHEVLHSRGDIDRLYVWRKERVRGFASNEDSVDASPEGLEDYIKKSKEIFIAATRNNSTGNIKIKRTTITKKQKWEEKQLYKSFKRQTNEMSHEKT